jgi:hypothetical protein
MNGKPMDRTEWSMSMERVDRIIGNDVIGEYRVSTVHVGLDMNIFCGQKPLIFETMIFGPEKAPLHMWQDRYTTKFNAQIGHEYACRLARGEVVESDSEDICILE